MADSKLLISLGVCRCTLCNCELDEGAGIMLKSCLHPFCRVCIYELVESAQTFEIRCPGVEGEQEIAQDGTMQCKRGGLVTLDEIEGILGADSPDLESYLRRASFNADNEPKVPVLSNKRKMDIPVEDLTNVKHFKPDEPVAAPTTIGEPGPSRIRTEIEAKTGIPAAATGDGIVDINLLRTEIESQCCFCAENLPKGDGIILQSCWHVFCRTCLRQTVQDCKDIKAKCPFPSTGGSCAGVLLDKEVKALVSDAEYSAYMRKSLTAAEKKMNVFRCKTLGCTGFCELDVNNNRSVFLCTVCQKMNCLKCQVVHDGIDCARYQELSAQMSIYARRNRKSIEKIVNGELNTGFHQLTELMQKTPQQNGNGVSHNSVLEKLEDLDLLPSTKKFECPICMTDIRVGKGIILRDCLHTFCRPCLVSSITHSEDVQVKCPYQDANYSCTAHLAPREIKALLQPAAHEAFTERATRLAEFITPNSFHCKTTNCTGWCEPNEDSRFFLCPVCDKVNCLKCEALHEDYTCEQHKDNVVKDVANREVQRKNELKGEQAIEKSLKSKTYVPCPRCKIICQKISGCAHVVCGACKLPFNWTGK